MGLDPHGFTNVGLTLLGATALIAYARYWLLVSVSSPGALPGAPTRPDLAGYGSIIISVVGAILVAVAQRSGSFLADLARFPRYLVRACAASLMFFGAALATADSTVNVGLSGIALAVCVSTTAQILLLRWASHP